jgi:hypothetical protein
MNFIYCSKLIKLYGVYKIQMPLPGYCVSAGTLVLNFGVTNMVPTQKHKTLPPIDEAVPTSKYINGLGTNRNFVMSPAGSRSQE